MGRNVDAEKPIDVVGRPGRFIGVTMKNPQANASSYAMNVFIPGLSVWGQVRDRKRIASGLAKSCSRFWGICAFDKRGRLDYPLLPQLA